jgi:uncharacterized membrane protein
MSVLYIIAGINHFLNVPFYERIMPPWLPDHAMLIYASGIAEISCGALLIPTSTRKAAAWATIVLLILIFPANIQMMINYINTNNPQLWLAILRLPLQVMLILWAKLYTR